VSPRAVTKSRKRQPNSRSHFLPSKFAPIIPSFSRGEFRKNCSVDLNYLKSSVSPVCNRHSTENTANRSSLHTPVLRREIPTTFASRASDAPENSRGIYSTGPRSPEMIQRRVATPEPGIRSRTKGPEDRHVSRNHTHNNPSCIAAFPASQIQPSHLIGLHPSLSHQNTTEFVVAIKYPPFVRVPPSMRINP
jgi:hypothetical protein